VKGVRGAKSEAIGEGDKEDESEELETGNEKACQVAIEEVSERVSEGSVRSPKHVDK
jgi:hypothetical protein